MFPLLRMSMFEGNWDVVGPVIGFIACYLFLQLIVLSFGCCIPPRQKKRGYHVMNNIGPRNMAVTIVTGGKKVSSLYGGKVVLNLRTTSGQILELDLDRCQRHDHGIFTYGRRDTFYIGYQQYEKLKMDQIGLSLVPYNFSNKSRWTCDYVYMRDCDGNRAHFFVDHSFFSIDGYSDCVFIEQESSKCRLFWKTFFHGISKWHLWISGFHIEAKLWQRTLPLYFSLAVMAATLSMSQGAFRIKEVLPMSLAASLLAIIAIITLECVFRHILHDNRSPCYCSDGSVRQVVRPLQHSRKRFISKGTEAAFMKCVRFSDSQGTQTCSLPNQHLPGSSNATAIDGTKPADFLQKHVDGLRNSVEVFAVDQPDVGGVEILPSITSKPSGILKKRNSTALGKYDKHNKITIEDSVTEGVLGSIDISANNSETDDVEDEEPSPTEDGMETIITENVGSTVTDKSIKNAGSSVSDGSSKNAGSSVSNECSENVGSAVSDKSTQAHGDSKGTAVVPSTTSGIKVSSSELLIKELVKRALTDPDPQTPSKQYSSTTILNVVKELGTKDYNDENYDDLVKDHLKSIIEDLHLALVHAGDCSNAQSRFIRLVAAKTKSQRRLLDVMGVLTAPGSVPQSEILIQTANEQRKACSDVGLQKQKITQELQHTSSDSHLDNIFKEPGDSHPPTADLDEKSLEIKASLSAFSSLRSQLVLETVCDQVRKELSAHREKFCPDFSNTAHRVIDSSKAAVHDSGSSSSRKATAAVLLDDVHESVMSISTEYLNQALMGNLDDLSSPEHTTMLQNAVWDLLHSSRKEFAEQFVDAVIGALSKQNEAADGSFPSPGKANQENNCDPLLTTSILRFVTDLFEKEIDNIEKSEETVCKFATALQYIDTVVTNALIQADKNIQHGMTCFNDIRKNSNNSNIGSQPGTLKYNILYHIVNKMGDDISYGNLSKRLFAELSARPVSNYIVHEALSRAKDYVYETSEIFDLDQLSNQAAQLCLIPNYDIMKMKGVIDAEDFIRNVTHELQNAAVFYGCQVVAEQLLDFFKHDEPTDALCMTDVVTRKRGGTLSYNYAKSAKKADKEALQGLLNLFDGCASHEELREVIKDLESIRNINQNQSKDDTAPSMARSANKIDELDLENGSEWGSLIESRWQGKISVTKGKQYWKNNLYQLEHDKLLHPATGQVLLCFLNLAAVLILCFLMWVGISNSFSFTLLWTKVFLIILVLHMFTFELVKILITSMIKVWFLKGSVR